MTNFSRGPCSKVNDIVKNLVKASQDTPQTKRAKTCDGAQLGRHVLAAPSGRPPSDQLSSMVALKCSKASSGPSSNLSYSTVVYFIASRPEHLPQNFELRPSLLRTVVHFPSDGANRFFLHPRPRHPVALLLERNREAISLPIASNHRCVFWARNIYVHAK